MNRIKIILLSLVAVGGALSAEAEEIVTEKDNSKHEVRVSLGIYPVLSGGLHYDYDAFSYGPTFSSGNYNQLSTYREYSESSVLSVGYNYEVSRRFSVGATFSYSNESRGMYSYIDDKVIDEFRVDNFSIIPTVRFTYLNRPMVRLYSQVGLGIRLQHDNSDHYINESSARVSASITYLGISVGQKFFGSMELSAGAQGVFSIGCGYRF